MRTGVPRRAPAFAVGKGPPPWARSEPPAGPSRSALHAEAGGCLAQTALCPRLVAGRWLQAVRVPRGECPRTCFNTIVLVPRVRRPAPSAPSINSEARGHRGKGLKMPARPTGPCSEGRGHAWEPVHSRCGAHGPVWRPGRGRGARLMCLPHRPGAAEEPVTPGPGPRNSGWRWAQSGLSAQAAPLGLSLSAVHGRPRARDPVSGGPGAGKGPWS